MSHKHSNVTLEHLARGVLPNRAGAEELQRRHPQRVRVRLAPVARAYAWERPDGVWVLTYPRRRLRAEGGQQ